MAKNNVAELRREAVYHLASRKDGAPIGREMAHARRVMNSYYRLCGLINNRNWHDSFDTPYHRECATEMTDRIDKWYDRLNTEFAEYGACLVQFGVIPCICERDEHGAPHDLHLRFFY